MDWKPDQLGSIVVFKKGTTKQQAEAALDQISDLIDANYYTQGRPIVNEFNSNLGGPVWYLP